PPPPAPAPQAERIRKGLKIGDCSVVDQTAKQIIIRLCDQVTFDPAQAIVKDQFKPIAARIAALLNKEEGVITVVGHTDTPPMQPVRCPSSCGRARAGPQAAAAPIKTGLAAPRRIKVVGRGPDVRIASNATPEGRAKNRRVEISIGRAND